MTRSSAAKARPVATSVSRASRAAKEILALPIHPELTAEQQIAIEQIMAFYT